MKSIGEFFKRIKNFQTEEIALRSSISDIINETIGLGIPIEKISIKAGIITLRSISHSARSTIYINKEKIINLINNKNGSGKIKDIRN